MAVDFIAIGIFGQSEFRLGLHPFWIDPERSICGSPLEESWLFILNDYRLPKATTAILVGGGLSVSGLLMQTLFRNPLAGPFVLGISSGATLGVRILGSGLITGLSASVLTGPWTMVLVCWR